MFAGIIGAAVYAYPLVNPPRFRFLLPFLFFFESQKPPLSNVKGVFYCFLFCMSYAIPMPPAVQYFVYVLEVVSAERTLEKIVAVRNLHFMLRSRKVPLFEYFPHHLAVRNI